MIDPAGRSTLVDDTADKIRQMILSGQIQPGELLPSRKALAEQFGVGISTIHEAVKSLAAVGLLESRPGKGTWVRHDALDGVIRPEIITNRFGQIDVETIYEARLVLEVALAGLAAEKATPEEIEEIWAALKVQQEAMPDDEKFIEADWAFHLTIAKASHNVLVETFYQLARELLLEFIRDAISLPRVREEATEYHIEQVKAIEAHDVAWAQRVAREHMWYVKRRLLI